MYIEHTYSNSITELPMYLCDKLHILSEELLKTNWEKH